jgi:hypothetical protein
VGDRADPRPIGAGTPAAVPFHEGAAPRRWAADTLEIRGYVRDVTRKVGVWIDHKRAMIVSASAGHLTTRSLESDVEAHPHYGGRLDGGGEKKYEERHEQHIDRYLDEVIRHLDEPDAVLILGPGEAKLQLKARLSRSKGGAERTIVIEAADKLTDAQIVAKVMAHFHLDR